MSELVDFGGQRLSQLYSTLDMGWRASVVKALNINASNFQLLCGLTTIENATTNAGLSLLADRLPSCSAVVHIPAQGKCAPRFSTEYRRLLGAILPETGVGLRGYLGDSYGSWVKTRNRARSCFSQRTVFAQWSQQHLPPGKQEQANALFDLAAHDPVSSARDLHGSLRFRDMRLRSSGQIEHVPSYGLTPARVRAALFPIQDGRLRFDSDEMHKADTGELTWLGAGHASRLPNLRNGNFDSLERRVASSRITITGEIAKRAVLPILPMGWYDPAFVTRAFNAGPCREVWDGWSDTGRWSTFFGSNGLIRRHLTQLVMVSGMRLSISVHGRFDDAERAGLAARLGLNSGHEGRVVAPKSGGVGVWPFALREGASDLLGQMRFDDAGTLHVSLRQIPGTFQCVGARVGTVQGVE
ncbi:hypothetical protein G5B39_06110 [Rhodobacteraceae bacterium SC52]|nr:hypothetical protein G5B39_06110 [Rhodobacteraceae bacterium SC52]